MSLSDTQKHLVHLLSDPDCSVIALTGKWGTGKSHLWRQVRNEAKDDIVKGSLYVSLFGLSSIDQLKKKLIESVVPAAEAYPKAWKSAKQAVTTTIKVLESFHKGFGALSDVGLLLAPSMLGKKLIVIDDVERKHEKLGIDEVLGFIDEYSQQHLVRFVLILNSDQLNQKPLWETFREKVIDQEIRLLTTPDEAFDIAIRLRASPHASPVKKAVVTCGITNIRVIRKVIGVVNRILGERQLTDAILARVVPSMVLLAAIHFKGIEDGPNFQFVLSIGSPDWAEFMRNDNEELNEEGKRKAKWRLLLGELGIVGCDEYEEMVIDYLEQGQFDVHKVSEIIDRYVLEGDAMQARDDAHQFMKRMIWDYRVDEADLVAEAAKLVPRAHLLDPYIATDLDAALAPLPGGPAVGDEIVQGWLAWFRAQNHEDIGNENPFGRPLHADIKREFDAIQARAQIKTTVFDACMHIAKHRGWGTREEVAMKTATAADFEATIKGLEIEDLRAFMRSMLEMRVQRQAYDHHFGAAVDRFAEACRNIANANDSGRLGTLIRRLFEDAKIDSDLVPESHDAPV